MTQQRIGAAKSPSNALANPGQRTVDSNAIRIFQTPEVRSARAEVAALYRADRNAASDEMRRRVTPAADAILFSSCLVAVNEDPCDPVISCFLRPAHQWMGLEVPDGRWGVDNPDNVYRFAPVDAHSAYRLRGRFDSARAADFGFSVLTEFFGEKGLNRTVGFLGIDALRIDADGSFAVTLDAQPSAGRTNHIELVPEARFLIMRDSLSNWSSQSPCDLQIERLSGPPAKTKPDGDLARRAANLGIATARNFLAMIQHALYERGPANQVLPPISAGANGGLVTQSSMVGHYRLGDDEALIVTADRLGARYMGFQLADLWMVSYDYDRRLSCLNHEEALPDADGLTRYVISASDPGVCNWLDGGGHHIGSMTLRWQGLPAGAKVDEHMVSGQVVKLADLRQALPAGTGFVSAEERRRQQEIRSIGYQRRFAEAD